MATVKRAGGKKDKGGPGYPAAFVGLVLGAFFFIGGLFAVHDQLPFVSHGADATGTVVGFHTYNSTGKGGCGGPGYNPVVSFMDSAGQKITATLTNKRICAEPANGSTVALEYVTTDPTRAQFPQAQNWVVPIVAVLGGAIFLLLGVAAAVSTAKTRRVIARGGPIPGSKNQRKKLERARARETEPNAQDAGRRLVEEYLREHRD